MNEANTKTNKTNFKKCLKEFLRYSSLNILGMLGLSCYILADTFFVSKAMGTNGLAALNIALPVFSFMLGVGLMLGMGGGIKYSILKVNDKNKANVYFTLSVKTAVVFAVLFPIIGLLFSRQLATILGAGEEIKDLTSMYIKTVMVFGPAFVFNNLMQCFVRNDGAPKLSMIAMVTGSLANVVLDYVFMFPFGLGMFGAALATGIAPVIGIIIQSFHIFGGKNEFKFVKTKFKPKRVFNIAALGFPSLVNELATGIVIIIFNLIIMDLSGNTGVAAYGVIANISMVVVSMFTGIAQGTQPLISEAFGEGKPKDVKLYLRLAVCGAVIVAAAVYGVIFFGADAITNIFNSEKDVMLQQTAVKGMKIYFTAIPFAGVNIILAAYFAATGKALPAHIISLMRGLVLIIPMAYLISFILQMNGVWLSFPVTEVLTAMFGGAIYASEKIKHKHKI